MRPEILYLVPQLAAQPRTGADIRTHRLVSALAHVADVDLAVVGRGDATALQESTGARQVRIYPRTAGRLRKALRAVQHGWPVGVAAAWSAELSDEVQQRAAEGWTVVAEHPQMAPYLPQRGLHALSTQNAEAGVLTDQVGTGGSPAARLRRAWDLSTMRRLEAMATQRAALTVAVSERDARLLGATRTVVVPNGTDPPAEVPPLPPRGDVLFIGNLRYPPNREAATWWCDHVWPHATGLPALTVVGAGTEGLPARLARHAAVTFVGEVPTVAPWLVQASVVVVPLHHGGGTRLKVLEALAWGRPVVSTSKGVEGLPVRDGHEVLLADTPTTFAKAVLRVREDRALAEALAGEGVRFAAAYRWDTLMPPFVREVLSLRAQSDEG